MSAIHLCMVELERNFECRFKIWRWPLQPWRQIVDRLYPVFRPNHERVVEYAAIHTHRPINVVLYQSWGADYHSFSLVVVTTCLPDLFCQGEIAGVENLQILSERHIAWADLIPLVQDNCVYCECVILRGRTNVRPLNQSVAYRQHIKLFYLSRRFPDTPTH